MENTENMDFQQQVQKVINEGTPEELQKLLMQQAVDSGELTKAFAQAWANRAVNGDQGGDGASDTEKRSRWLSPLTEQMQRKERHNRGVTINY